MRCGRPLQGRPDKKFCDDGCRIEWHNEQRRKRQKELRVFNVILEQNWRILAALLRKGQRSISVKELALRQFNFEIYTATNRRFLARRIYWCYNYAYSISPAGTVRILPPQRARP